jgi:ABC-type nitrate/sulfonate/bicarbonate transport system substrate-binding protein
VVRGCHVLARGDQIISCYQGTVGAAKRSWAENNRELLISYIRAYVEVTQWCFDTNNRASCLELLATHNGIEGKAAEETLDALLDSGYGMYPKAELNLPGAKGCSRAARGDGLSQTAAAPGGEVHRSLLLQRGG